jgi:hypothetical protein
MVICVFEVASLNLTIMINFADDVVEFTIRDLR